MAELDIDSREILADADWSFLVGAGISKDPPSNLPSAREIVRHLLQLCVPEAEFERLYHLPRLRYELIVEVFQQLLDTNLKFMDYFELVETPNLIHKFLAAGIAKKCGVVTTNFDYLLEHALKDYIAAKEHKKEFRHYKVRPIITQEDFMAHPDYKQLYIDKNLALFKIHGSKRDIIAGRDTADSLVTTISDLGKNRAEGETFAIEPYKKPAVYHLTAGHGLVVMGYSGSDDFDIGPVLKELPELKRLIWVEHQEKGKITIESITQDSLEAKKEKSDDMGASLRLLREIALHSDADVFLIQGNTKKIVQTWLWPHFFPKETLEPNHSEKKESSAPRFSDWVKKIYGGFDPAMQYFFASRVYFELSQFRDVIRSAEKGLALSQKPQSSQGAPTRSSFYNLLALSCKELGEMEQSRDYYQKSLEADEKAGDWDGISSALSGIGYLYFNQGQFDEALPYFQRCLDIAEAQNFTEKRGNYLNNLAMLHFERGDPDLALQLLQEALKIAEAEGALGQKAMIFSNMGRILKIEKRYDESMAYYQQALRINQELGQYKAVATRYNLIGQIYYMQERYGPAEEMFVQAEQIYRELGEVSNRAKSRGNIALIYTQRGEHQKALTIYEDLIKTAEKLGEMGSKAIRLNNIGYIYQSQENYPQSLSYFKQAADIDKRQGFSEQLATDYNNIGLSYYYMAKYPESQKFFENALDIAKSISHKELETTIEVNLRDLYEKRGEDAQTQENYSIAAKWYQKSYEIEVRRNHDENQAYYLTQMGISLYFGNDNAAALTNLEKALEIALRLEAYKKISDALYYIGLILQEQNKINEALGRFRESYHWAEEGNLTDDLIILSKKIGDLYTKQGDFGQSTKYYDLQISFLLEKESIEGEDDQDQILDHLILVSQQYSKINEPDVAINRIRQAFALAQKWDRGQAVVHIGYVLGYQLEIQLKDEVQALEIYQKAVRYAEKYQITEIHTKILFQIAKIYKNQKKWVKATEMLTTSLILLNQIKDRNQLAHHHNLMGSLQLLQGDYQQALSHYQQALSHFESMQQGNNVAIVQKNIQNIQKKIDEEQKS